MFYVIKEVYFLKKFPNGPVKASAENQYSGNQTEVLRDFTCRDNPLLPRFLRFLSEHPEPFSLSQALSHLSAIPRLDNPDASLHHMNSDEF